MEGASLTTAEPPALRGLVLSQRDKTHHLVPAAALGSELSIPRLPLSERLVKFFRKFAKGHPFLSQLGAVG